ncbi:MAG: DUF3341 domain-containing protein [Fimbriimonadales bacterium]
MSHAIEVTQGPKVYGYIAEFEEAEQLVSAARKVADAGYRDFDAFSPFPIHGLPEAMRFKDARVPWIIFFCGLIGAVVGYGLQYYVTVFDYPMNVGGRPNHSWVQYIPITFECTVLFAALGAVVGMFGLNGLPRPYHPVFEAKNFERASEDRFFLVIEATDGKFDAEGTRRFLESLGPVEVNLVEAEEI